MGNALGFFQTIAGFDERCTFDNKLRKNGCSFVYLPGLMTHREAFTRTDAHKTSLCRTTHFITVFLFGFCFFHWLEGHFVSWKSAQGDQRKCQTRFISNGMSRGENEGQLKRGVWTLTQQRVVVSTATLSARRLLKLSRAHAGQSGHLCSHSGSCLMAAL